MAHDDADALHPLFITGLPPGFASNATLLALANVDAPIEDDDDSSLGTSQPGKRPQKGGANGPGGPASLKQRVVALRSRHTAERQGLDRRAGRLDLDDVSRRFSGATLAKPKVEELRFGVQAAPAAAAARPPPSSPVAVPLASFGSASSSRFQIPAPGGDDDEGENGDGDDPPAAAARHDPSVAALCTFMHVWKPSAGATGAEGAAVTGKPA